MPNGCAIYHKSAGDTSGVGPSLHAAVPPPTIGPISTRRAAEEGNRSNMVMPPFRMNRYGSSKVKRRGLPPWRMRRAVANREGIPDKPTMGHPVKISAEPKADDSRTIDHARSRHAHSRTRCARTSPAHARVICRGTPARWGLVRPCRRDRIGDTHRTQHIGHLVCPPKGTGDSKNSSVDVRNCISHDPIGRINCREHLNLDRQPHTDSNAHSSDRSSDPRRAEAALLKCCVAPANRAVWFNPDRVPNSNTDNPNGVGQIAKESIFEHERARASRRGYCATGSACRSGGSLKPLDSFQRASVSI